jgi:hypothetical protein
VNDMLSLVFHIIPLQPWRRAIAYFHKTDNVSKYCQITQHSKHNCTRIFIYIILKEYKYWCMSESHVMTLVSYHLTPSYNEWRNMLLSMGSNSQWIMCHLKKTRPLEGKTTSDIVSRRPHTGQEKPCPTHTQDRRGDSFYPSLEECYSYH